MARSTNRMITFNDAQYMVTNEGFTAKQAIPASEECMTRADIEAYLKVDTAFGNFLTYANNELVPYEELAPGTIPGLIIHLDAGNTESYPGSGTTWFDISGNNNHGTMTNVSYGTSLGGTMNFDGTGVVTIPFNATMNFNNEQTIILILNATESDGVRRNPYNQAYGGGGTWTHEPNNSINYYFGTNGGNASPYTPLPSAYSVTPETPTMYVTSRNLTTAFAYANGNLTNTVSHPYSTGIVTGTQPILIGDGYTDNFIGNIALVMVFDRCLTATEISDIYTQYSGRLSAGVSTLTISPTSQSVVASSPGPFTVTVTSNTSWVVTEQTSWLSTNISSGSGNGSFSVSTSTNTSTSSRSANISVSTNDGIIRTLTVNQAAGADTTAPTIGTLSSGGASGETNIPLQWTAATDNIGIANYSLEQKLSSVTTWTTISNTIGGTITTFNRTGLNQNASYDFRIRAVDAAGNWSAYSNIFTASTVLPAPGAPSNLTATTLGTTSVRLNWTAGTNAEYYRIEVNSVFHAYTSTAATTYDVTGLSPATTYSFRIRSYNSSSNSGYSNTATATTLSNSSNISTTDLILHLDAADPTSYSGSGTVWNDISGNNNHWEIEFPADYNTTTPKAFNLLDLHAYFRIGAMTPAPATSGTLVYWIKTTDNQSMFLHSLSTSGSYVGAYRVGNKFYSSSTGSYHQDLVTSGVNPYDNLPDGNWHMVEIKGVNISTFTSYYFNQYSSYTFGNGQIGKIMFYNKVLTAAESQQNFDADKDRYGATVPAPDTIAPTMGTVSSGGTPTQTSIPVQWTAATDNVSVVNYGFEYKNSGTSTWSVISETFSSSTLSYTVSGLIADNTYNFRVRAKDAAGNWSAYSNIYTTSTATAAPPAPGAPSNLTATTLGTTSVRLNWTAGTNAEYYRIEVNSVFHAYTSTAATTYDVTGLSPSTTYSFRIRSYNVTSNSGYSNTASATTSAAPDTIAPTMGTVSANGTPTQTSIPFKWTAATDNVGVVNYSLEQKTSTTSTWTTISNTIGSTVTTYNRTGLSASITYNFRMRAVDAAGNWSAYSNTFSATTATPVASTVSMSAISLTFPYTAGGLSIPVESNTSWNVTESASWINISPTSNSGNDNFVTSVIQNNGAARSAIVTVTSTDGTASDTVTIYQNAYVDEVAPTLNTSLTTTASTSSSVSLAWGFSDNIGVTSQKVLWRNIAGGLWTVLTVSASATTYTVTGLSAPNTTYEFYVTACDAANNCTDSNIATRATTAAADTTPPAFSKVNLSSTGNTQTSIALQWGSVSDNVGVTSLTLYWRLNGGTYSTIALSTSTTTYNKTGLTAGRTYNFYVRACDAAGNCTDTNILSAATESNSQTIQLSTYYMSVGYQPSDNSLIITSNPSWSLGLGGGGATTSPSSGTGSTNVIVSVETNPFIQSRVINVTYSTPDGTTATLQISQAGNPTGFG